MLEEFFQFSKQGQTADGVGKLYCMNANASLAQTEIYRVKFHWLRGSSRIKFDGALVVDKKEFILTLPKFACSGVPNKCSYKVSTLYM